MKRLTLQTNSAAVTLLRNIYRALRISVDPAEPPHLCNRAVWKGVTNYVRLQQNKANTEQTGIAAQQLGETYLVYLQSNRRHLELIQSYKGAGERSAREAASLMGFNMPDEPKVLPKRTRTTNTKS